MKRFLGSIFVLLTLVSSMHGDKLETIMKENRLKVCIWPGYYGISYLDPRTQELAGIDSDLAKELAKDLKVDLEYVQSSFATLIKDIDENKCDIAMFAIGNTPSRREKIRFTTPHLSSDIYAITTKSNNKIQTWDDLDKKGNILAVAKGTYHEPIMKEKLENAELLVVNGFKAREQEVLSGRADAFMTDYPFGKRMLAKTDWAKLIIPQKEYYKTPYAWAMAYGNDKFYERVEKFISDIKKDGRLLKLSKNNGLEAIAKLN
ncbi:MAG: amino acid ABC transporter substrate-binding protein [Arcobacter sp.]|uniref:substrate-binding periplasmic protein n=1 Tax=uncultured Arcobacter sp. TaxID=165434 RepID=UPI000CAC2E8D|nr:ABC transporter substrate-binding protein [uncultured Arcobacter sp.]PLY08538.1 MAG: amino acid ABC transporter substrate-binding protein [Arcobacter sp.]